MSTPDQESEALADKQVAPDLKQNGDLNKSFIFCSFNLSLHCAAVQEHYDGPCRAQDHPWAEGYWEQVCDSLRRTDNIRLQVRISNAFLCQVVVVSRAALIKNLNTKISEKDNFLCGEPCYFEH